MSTHFEFEVEEFDLPAGFEDDEEVGRLRRPPARSASPRVNAPRPQPVPPRKPKYPRPIVGHRTNLHTPESPAASEYVRWVQTMLNQALNLQLPIDGVLDVQTRSAVRSFQKKNDLPVTGIVGPDTVRALHAPGAPSSTAPAEPLPPVAEPELFDLELIEPEWESKINPGLAPVPGIEKTSPRFRQRVIEIAGKLGMDPTYLMAVMSFESNLDPAARNPYSGATGLIQFMPSTAARLGTSTDALRSMTAEQQLEYVARYFEPYRGRLITLEDAYMAVLWPTAIGRGPDFVLFSSPSSAYRQNSALDINKDGRITVAEATSFVRRRLGSAAPPPGGSTQPVGTGSLNRSSRDYIKWVQRSLNQILGLRLAVDGISGTQTRSAVRSFQQQRGLTVDGIVGSQTEAALIAAGAGNPPRVGSPSPTPAPPAPGGAPSATWVLPPDVRAAGERQYVRYDSPPAWDNGRNCTGSLTAGAAELGDYLQFAFRGISSVEGCSCRQNTANLAQTSVHGTGRALDIMIPKVNGRANSAVGDPIANWLVQNAQAIGVQYIIWNRTRWSGSYNGRKDGAYGGPNPHIDHVHVELNRNGAARSTPWFLGRI